MSKAAIYRCEHCAVYSVPVIGTSAFGHSIDICGFVMDGKYLLSAAKSIESVGESICVDEHFVLALVLKIL